MTPDPRPVDLLVVGALAIDQFPDGSAVPGGSVLHAVRAMAPAGRPLAVVTIAGHEPEAEAGLRELRTLAAVHLLRSEATTTFAIAEGEAGRQLTLVARSRPMASAPASFRPAAVLYAPLAGELGPDLAGQDFPGATRGAALQGWLRVLDGGERVEPLPLTSLPTQLVATLAECSLLVASREDLAAVGEEPALLLDALRSTFGARPVLVVTAGTDGVWLDLPGEGRGHVEAPEVVDGVSTIGAGDAYAGLLLDAIARGVEPLPAARDAAGGVAQLLAKRRLG